jgi:hypothetical protein
LRKTGTCGETQFRNTGTCGETPFRNTGTCGETPFRNTGKCGAQVAGGAEFTHLGGKRPDPGRRFLFYETPPPRRFLFYETPPPRRFLFYAVQPAHTTGTRSPRRSANIVGAPCESAVTTRARIILQIKTPRGRNCRDDERIHSVPTEPDSTATRSKDHGNVRADARRAPGSRPTGSDTTEVAF